MQETIPGVLDGDSELQRIVTGCTFTEGPLWLRDGRLIFSDIPADRMLQWVPSAGPSVARFPNNKGNGMTLTADGDIVVCEHATSRVVSGRFGGSWTTLASHWEGRELNSPNDVIVARDGSVIFSDPTYGRISPDFGTVRDLQQDIRGVYLVPPRGGPLRLLVDDCVQPNGLCLSSDESILYVGDTGRAHIRAFRMSPSGPLAGEVFASGITESPDGDDGFVDGMKLDDAGNVYVTGPGGIWVFDPAGRRLGIIEVPEQPANLNWGDGDWSTLYITARSSVYRLRMSISALRLPYMS